MVFLTGAFASVFAQNNSLHIKSWVKKNEILLRWAPYSKEIFDLGAKNGYKIIRTDKNGNSIVISESVKPLAKEDSLWFKILKSNKNAMVAAGALHNNISKAKDPKKKSEQEMMLYNLMLLSCDFDAAIAKVCGLFYSDKSIDNSNTYTYKIVINNLPSGSKIQPGLAKVNSSVLSVNPSIQNLSGIFKNKSVRLKWKASEYKNDFGGYNIERSKDSINFTKLNSSPVILLSSQFEKNKEFIYYLDTFPTVKERYYYRIIGLNHFGEWSQPSNIISSVGYDPLKSFPVLDTIYTIKNQTVFMHWRMQDKNENNAPKEYVICRAAKDKGPYDIVYKAADKFEFIDQKPNAANFYKVGAISYGGDTLYSYSYMVLITDTIPPTIPTGLKAKTDNKGNVILTWNKNPEQDIKGYKIFRSNALHEEFVQINNEFAVEPVFNDKLNLKTLSKKIYYRISAADKRYNNSGLCEPVEVRRPDTIAPVAAIVTALQLSQNGIKVNWINSSSEDVKYSVLYRENESDKIQQKVKEWQAKDTTKTFLDTTIIMGEGYRYKILVSDENDNITVSNNPYMRFETGFRKKINEIKYEVDRAMKTVTLNWSYNEKNVEKFVIYRCKKKGVLTIIKTLPATANSFTDKTLNIGNVYEYRIKPVFTNGAEGIISDGVEVEY